MYDSLAIKQLRENSTWYLLLGIGLAILGTLFIFYSFSATVISMYFLGSAAVVYGVFQAFKSFKMSKWSSFFLHMFLAILYIVFGIFIIINPVENALSLTLLLAIAFVIAGVIKMFFALSQNPPHRNWVLLSGIVSLVLGILIWVQWPISGMWVIGTFIGIDMIFTGWTWIYLSMLAKKM